MNNLAYTGAQPCAPTELTKHGVTLLEIVFAVFILIATLVPIYMSLNRQAASAEDTEKMQMAEKILTSIKEELQATDFKRFVTYAKDNQPDAQKRYPLEDGFYPTSLDRILTFQKKYRDFKTSGQWFFILRGGQSDNSLIQVNMKVTWVQPEGVKERTSSVVLVAPR